MCSCEGVCVVVWCLLVCLPFEYYCCSDLDECLLLCIVLMLLVNRLARVRCCLDKSVAISVLRVLDYLHVSSQINWGGMFGAGGAECTMLDEN